MGFKNRFAEGGYTSVLTITIGIKRFSNEMIALEITPILKHEAEKKIYKYSCFVSETLRHGSITLQKMRQIHSF